MNNFLKVFCWIAAIHLLAKLFGNLLVDQLTKPLLLPLLSAYFIQATYPYPSRQRLLFITALFFSWMGDVVLMFGDQKELFFIMGLAFFLLTQLIYASLFYSWADKASLSNLSIISAILPFTLFGIFLLLQLMPYLGALRIPVIIYASAITLMGIAAGLTYHSLRPGQSILLISGSIFFIVSDSILAMHKFIIPVPLSGFWVMLTYLLAQLLLAAGVVKIIRQED